MNALSRATAITVPRAAAQTSGRRTVMTMPKWADWNDVSAYPMIGVLSFAVVGCCTFMTYKMSSTPDVRIGSTRKGEVLRTW